MKFFFRIFFINIFWSLVTRTKAGPKAGLYISKVVVRVPKENDIGLIFDVSITNVKQNNQGERLQFNIRAANGCQLDLGDGKRFMNEAGRIVGGSFGCIEPGTTETVSLIWPTISLYNRVGCCPIIITSTNVKDVQCHLKETLTFDTKFETLDPQCTGIRRSKNYKDCHNFDLDYLNNCRPVNCEERYFGIRNFFNECSLQCEPAPPCQGQVHYDPFTNECVNAHYAVCKKDIHDIKLGYFKNYEEWTKELSRNSLNYHKISKHSKRESVYSSGDDEISDLISDKDNAALHSTFIKGTIDGLMLVFATIGIYVFICFVIFLIVTCISRRQGIRNSISFSEAPSVSEKGIPIRSRSSLISRR